MKKTSKALLAGISLTLALALAACSASGGTTSAAYSSAAPAMAAPAARADDSNSEAAVMESPELAAQEESGAGASGAQLAVTADSSRKLIRRITVEMETKQYDALIAAISQQIAAAGGYLEESRQQGDAKEGRRYTYVMARVPKDKADAFLAALAEFGSVRSREESSEDVTLSYTDVESHKKVLAVEQERLLELMEQADKIEDIIALEERLSNVRYELEHYESQLRAYDNLIDYTTIHLSVNEVERISPVEEKTVWSRISTGFEGTLYRIADGAENFFVWFVVNLPLLAIWAVVLTLAVLLLRRLARRHAQRSEPGALLRRRGKRAAQGGEAQSAPEPEQPAETGSKEP